MRLLSDLALFVEVARTGNFSRAAAAMEMPASTVSRRIAALERELGVTLIHRSTRSFRLTEAGEACYAQSRTLVAEAQRIQEDVAGIGGRASGHFRVGVPFDLAQTLFVPLFSRFMQEHEGTSIEVTAVSGHPNVLTEGLDVAVLVGHQLRLPDSSFASRRVGSFSRYLYASRSYLAKRGKPKEPSELTEHTCLRLMHGRPLSDWELRRDRERRTVIVSGTATATSVGMLAKFAGEGMGIAILPEFLARHRGLGDGLIRVLPDWEAVPAHLFAVTPSAVLTARMRAFQTFLKENLGNELTKLVL